MYLRMYANMHVCMYAFIHASMRTPTHAYIQYQFSTNEHPFQFILNPALMTAPWLRFVGAKQ